MASALESIMPTAAPQAQPSAGPPPPPPGFVVANDTSAPPPPKGFVLASDLHRTGADYAGMGGRAVLQGGQDVGDFAQNLIGDMIGLPHGAISNIGNAGFVAGSTLAGHPALPPGADQIADKAHLATPVTSAEKIGSAAVRGATAGLALGPGAMEAGARETGLTVLQMLARDAASGGAAASAGATAQAIGAPQPVQTAVALTAGLLAPKAAEAIGARFGANAAKVADTVPASVAVDPKTGDLTEEGQEQAAQAGVHPDALKGAYAIAANDPAEASPPVAAQAGPAVAETAPATAVPVSEPQAAAAPAEAAPEPVQPVSEPSVAPTAAARVAQAQSEGVDLTKGQATQNFDTQINENVLKDQPTAQGEQARQFAQQQQQQIQGALDRFQTTFGDPDATAETRGAAIQQTVRDLRDQGKAGVSALYDQARTLAEAVGDGASNLIHLDTAPLLAKMRELFIDEAIPDGVRRALKQQAAKYGLIGSNPQTVEGETTVQLNNASGEPASKITFTGNPEPLTILNAENLRQKINQLYQEDTTRQTQGLKPILDQAVTDAAERAATEGKGDVGKTFQAARQGYVTHQQTFKNNDIVQQIVNLKNDSTDPVIPPEQVIAKIFGASPDAITNLKKVKVVLLSHPTEASNAAWTSIKAHAVAIIFDKAMVLNSNPGEGMLGTVNGAKLNTAIAKFGVDKLKVLLAPEEFNQLMKLKRITGDVTIPINKTVNTSNTASLLFRFLAQKGADLASAVHGVAASNVFTRATVKGLQEAAARSKATRTLKGVTGYSPQQAAQDSAPQPEAADLIRSLLKSADGKHILAPLAVAANQDHRS